MTDTRPTTDLRIHPRADVVPFPDPVVHEQMAADVERRGIVTPLDILEDGTVLDGRTRLSIARVLGLAEVPVRVVAPDDPYDFMVRAAFMRRDLTKSQRAMVALELPEYQKAKAEAAERTRATQAQPGERVGQARTFVSAPSEPTHTRATDAIAPLAGVSGSYIRKAALVAERAPAIAEQVKAGTVTVSQAAEFVTGRSDALVPREEPMPKEDTRRLPIPKRTRPLRPWARHFTSWCRGALPEDRPVLLEMAREIDQALSRIGATK